MRDIGAERANDADRLGASPDMADRLGDARLPTGLQQVAVVYGRERDVDDDLARPRLGRVQVDELQHVCRFA